MSLLMPLTRSKTIVHAPRTGSYNIAGHNLTINAIGNLFDVRPETMASRVRRGMSPLQAATAVHHKMFRGERPKLSATPDATLAGAITKRLTKFALTVGLSQNWVRTTMEQWWTERRRRTALARRAKEDKRNAARRARAARRRAQRTAARLVIYKSERHT
jgi:hypothetical protein